MYDLGKCTHQDRNSYHCCDCADHLGEVHKIINREFAEKIARNSTSEAYPCPYGNDWHIQRVFPELQRHHSQES